MVIAHSPILVNAKMAGMVLLVMFQNAILNWQMIPLCVIALVIALNQTHVFVSQIGMVYIVLFHNAMEF